MLAKLHLSKWVPLLHTFSHDPYVSLVIHKSFQGYTANRALSGALHIYNSLYKSTYFESYAGKFAPVKMGVVTAYFFHMIHMYPLSSTRVSRVTQRIGLSPGPYIFIAHYIKVHILNPMLAKLHLSKWVPLLYTFSHDPYVSLVIHKSFQGDTEIGRAHV